MKLLIPVEGCGYCAGYDGT